jgi:hypothetical protein
MSNNNIDNIIEIFLTDKNLVKHIEDQVKKRLPQHSDLDPIWVQQVVDFTIDETFKKLDILKLVEDHQDYFTKINEKNNTKNKIERKSSPSSSPSRNLISSLISPTQSIDNNKVLPNYSSSEPIQIISPNGRKGKRGSSPKFNSPTSLHSSPSIIKNGEIIPITSSPQVKPNSPVESNFIINNDINGNEIISLSPKLKAALSIAKRSIPEAEIIKELERRSPSSSPIRSIKSNNDSIINSSFNSNGSNNAGLDNDFDDDNDNNDNEEVKPKIDLSKCYRFGSTFPSFNNDTYASPKINQSPDRKIGRYNKSLTSIGTNDEEEVIESLINNYHNDHDDANVDDYGDNDNNEYDNKDYDVFTSVNKWVESIKIKESPENKLRNKLVDNVININSPIKNNNIDPEIANEEDYYQQANNNDRIFTSPNYRSPNNSFSNNKDECESGDYSQIDEFYEEDFPQEDNKNQSKELSIDEYASDEFEPTIDSPTRNSNKKGVNFINKDVSNVFYFREKYNEAEKEELFYTFEEGRQFHIDYDNEGYQASKEDITWNDWIEKRTEEFFVYEIEYDKISHRDWDIKLDWDGWIKQRNLEINEEMDEEFEEEFDDDEEFEEEFDDDEDDDNYYNF